MNKYVQSLEKNELLIIDMLDSNIVIKNQIIKYLRNPLFYNKIKEVKLNYINNKVNEIILSIRDSKSNSIWFDVCHYKYSLAKASYLNPVKIIPFNQFLSIPQKDFKQLMFKRMLANE